MPNVLFTTNESIDEEVEEIKVTAEGIGTVTGRRDQETTCANKGIKHKATISNVGLIAHKEC